MKHLFAIILLISLLFSCSNHADIPVWKITKADSPESFIIGTIDYLNKEENGELLNNLITSNFKNSETYITQIDVLNSDFLLTKQELEIGMNRTLKEVMNESDFNELKEMVSEFNKTEKNNFNPPDSNRTKLIFYLQDLIYNNNQANFYFEQYFIKQARASKKNVIGLETYQDFYLTQAQVPYQEQVNFMKKINHVQEFSDAYKNRIAEFYKIGDLEGIHSFTIDKFPYLETNYSSFYTNKHKFWAASIDTALTKQKCFITLNVDHLAGENNFIESLLSKGYNVKKIQ